MHLKKLLREGLPSDSFEILITQEVTQCIESAGPQAGMILIQEGTLKR